MKKVIIGFVVLGSLAIASVAFSYNVTQIARYDYTAIIERGGTNILIYTVDQEKATCYVTVNDNPQLGNAISCLPKTK